MTTWAQRFLAVGDRFGAARVGGHSGGACLDVGAAAAIEAWHAQHALVGGTRFVSMKFANRAIHYGGARLGEHLAPLALGLFLSTLALDCFAARTDCVG